MSFAFTPARDFPALGLASEQVRLPTKSRNLRDDEMPLDEDFSAINIDPQSEMQSLVNWVIVCFTSLS